MNDYDYIITGAGCAGLSLLYRLLNDPTLNTKKILILDKDKKNTNDRTWCFWEKEKGIFEEIVTHEWSKLAFLNNEFTKEFELQDYSYKMIKGLDFYNFVLEYSKGFENLSFKQESILNIETRNNRVVVSTEKTEYTATYVFNSTSIFNPEINAKNALLQHFKGWVIKTKKPSFDSSIGTLMDFRVSQNHGDTFMYVLPTSTTEALVEYTLFTEKVLENQTYDQALKSYIKEVLKLDDYEILHTEYGIIPMSMARFVRNVNADKNIVNIGTAGGFTKASSGYTFQFIQKNTEKIVQNLRQGKAPSPKPSYREKMYQWYDRTLLEVIISKKLTGKEIFSIMFKKIAPEKIFMFLGNESSLQDDIKIMLRLPIIPFLKSGIKKLF